MRETSNFVYIVLDRSSFAFKLHYTYIGNGSS